MDFNKKLLRHKIAEAGITQVELAGMIGVTSRTVNRWLQGGKPPKASYIEKLAKELHCRPEDFDPRYADGKNEIHVEGRVTAASHNAYATMKLIYGVDHQTIIELAPILFSIVAARAVNLPGQDEAWWGELDREAKSLGFPRLDRFQNPADQDGFAIDEQAAQSSRCFGLKAEDEIQARPRNLFVAAMQRMTHEAGSDVSMDQFVPDDAGEAPTAIGFNPHVALYDSIAEGDAEIVRKLVDGDLRLSLSVTKAEFKANGSLEEYAEIIRNDLAEQAANHRAKLAARREEGLSRLSAWRAFYQERHPDLAREYDDLVAAYCKPEGWYPEYYSEASRELDYANPFIETRFIDGDLLPSKHDASERRWLRVSFNAPESQRLRELEGYRRLSKAEFGEMGR